MIEKLSFDQSGRLMVSKARDARIPPLSAFYPKTMLELNPVRQRISDLTDRVVSLRGYL